MDNDTRIALHLYCCRRLRPCRVYDRVFGRGCLPPWATFVLSDRGEANGLSHVERPLLGEGAGHAGRVHESAVVYPGRVGRALKVEHGAARAVGPVLSVG